MTLRSRIRWLLVVAAVSCVSLISIALYQVNRTFLDRLNEQTAGRELQKVEAAFLDQLSVLRVRAEDWTQQPDKPPLKLDGVGHLDLLMALENDRIVWQQDAEALLADGVAQRLAGRFAQSCSPIWGVVRADDRALLFITAVENHCEAYLLGVWLDSAWMSYLSDRVGHALYVQDVSSGAEPVRGLAGESSHALEGRFPLPDYLGGAPLEVVVDLPRDGMGSMATAVIAMIVIMFVLTGLTVIVVNMRIHTMLFGRLRLVHNAVRSIARGGALDQRLPVLSDDEIGELAMDFNSMVDSIENAQNQLAEARLQAESASKTKSQFLANMSHEIRTPMTAILGYTELLRGGSLTQEEQKRYLTIIQHNGDALLALINDVLDLSRIEAGQVSGEQRVFSPQELLDEVVDSLQLRAREKGLQLALSASTALPATVSGDVFRLRQILMNLAGNAVKFTEHGHVRVQASWDDEGQCLKVRVDDTGIGISEAQLKSIFQPFSQVDASHSRRYAGTGLGLSIARELARAHGGDITVSSREGRGSCFELVLPLVVASAMPSRHDSQPGVTVLEGPLAGRVLLAEDNQVNRLFVQKVLENAGLTVIEAENGREACREYADNPDFDLIVLDMQMPEMDGYQAVAELRDRGFTGPVLALTANVLAMDRQRCLDAGCDEFLGKPVRIRELIQVCSRLLSQAEASLGLES
ncbi:ATP-binding protein [Alcanivorax sp. S6407]|uniref:hybrid sensor histidine kinase/response regulator n=1 Tax=Alcanivorax sp. S6407 TaxID=2926424 RepID=UPI001FF2997C|nr:ATP-binding protein [Alcanivorax sp. S6407]MCK0152143.1 ATP-binding protein [Alcanivorax sp. S6407]